MTPKQLQSFLDRHGLSQRGAAAAVGIGERTMRRYVAGDLPVPVVVELALRGLVYGEHRPDCPKHPDNFGPDQTVKKCVCGFDRASDSGKLVTGSKK
jgi:hypothetical protein